MPTTGNGRRALPYIALGLQTVAMVVGITAYVAPLHTKIEERTQDRYRAAEAEADFRLRDEQIRHLRVEVMRLERELEAKPPRWLIERLERIERTLNPYEGQNRRNP